MGMFLRALRLLKLSVKQWGAQPMLTLTVFGGCYLRMLSSRAVEESERVERKRLGLIDTNQSALRDSLTVCE